MTASTVQYSLVLSKKFVGDAVDRSYDVIAFFRNRENLRRLRVASFTDTIRIAITIKKFFRNLTKLKTVTN